MSENAIRQINKLAENDISRVEHVRALELLSQYSVAVFIVAYNAELSIESVVRRIPKQILPLFAEIFIIDDSSMDKTFTVAKQITYKYPELNFNVYRTPFNRGYGGNQKLGYLYCIDKKYDFVVLLHGDGQYAPEFLPRVLAAFNDSTDAVFASRMIDKKMALRGGMPMYKWIGNQFLTLLENWLMGTRLSEFHTGFRAYRVNSLGGIPFIFNSDDFHFDTEIIIQAIASNWMVKEVAIPTHYGDEKCHVDGMKYAFNCIKSVIKYHLVNLGLFYERNFDFGLFESENYYFKKSPNSLHQHLLKKSDFNSGTVSIELGAKKGILSSHIAKRVKKNTAVDSNLPDSAGDSIIMNLDLNDSFSGRLPEKHYDSCVALDIIEHLDIPEHFLLEVFNILKVNGKLYISTSNVGYLPIRVMLCLGQFNYGKRGILDKTHKRLFTIRSFKKILKQHNFEIESVRGFAPPLTDLVSERKIMKIAETIHSFMSRSFPKLFAYNFLVIAKRMDALDDIFVQTIK